MKKKININVLKAFNLSKMMLPIEVVLTIEEFMASFPLHELSRRNESQLLFRLVKELSMDINQKNEIGQTPLHIACIHGHIESVWACIQLNADVTSMDNFGYTALHQVCGNHEKIVSALLSENISINTLGKIGKTPLHIAVIRSDKHAVKALLVHDADPNIEDEYNYITPLHTSASNGHIEISDLLVQYGAYPHAKDVYGNTPHSIASAWMIGHLL